ncbi:hypothetical protein [Alphaspiravirus yamagawaense]|uniref:Nucleotidyltransferase n=1 Tax=Alphaspiravirus yamagawaense TaxID=1157339 RepID=J7Q329_9VIRU|nr:hypothetical protein [Aeropyrum coil-shaped virus]CCG27853.1 hypothetical protein [Aeropyrum coil-shaped virus]
MKALQRMEKVVEQAKKWASKGDGIISGSVAAWLQGIKLQLRDADIIVKKMPSIKEVEIVKAERVVYGSTINDVVAFIDDGVGVELVANPVVYRYLAERGVVVDGLKVVSLSEVFAMKLAKLAISLGASKADIIWHQVPKTVSDLLLLYDEGVVDFARVRDFIETFGFRDAIALLRYSHIALEVQMSFTLASYYLGIYDYEEVMEIYRSMMRETLEVLGV